MSEGADRDDTLREMAQHRGFKLLKSRRRKPGVGDFGRFGLSDATGKPVIGIGPDGLTATWDEIEAYLRTGAENSWKASAESTPRRAKATRVLDSDTAAAKPRLEDARTDRKPRGAQGSSANPAGKFSSARSARSGLKASKPAEKSPKIQARSIATDRPLRAELLIRKAKKEDADPLAALLSQMSGVDCLSTRVTENMAAVRKAGGGLLLAERGGLIGCIAWAVIPTFHCGSIGRITAIVVTARERRKGVARKLVEGALAALEEAGCTSVEAMSDIDIRNSHGFFRSLDFVQASYRFTRSTAQSGT